MAKARQCQFDKRTLRARDFFVPLFDDWFIRPLYFVESLDDAATQSLVQAIYAYFSQYFSEEQEDSHLQHSGDLLRITKSELAFLSVYLLRSQVENLSEQSLAMIDKTIESVFFKRTKPDDSLFVHSLNISANPYLLEAYKQTFLADNLV